MLISIFFLFGEFTHGQNRFTFDYFALFLGRKILELGGNNAIIGKLKSDPAKIKN